MDMTDLEEKLQQTRGKRLRLIATDGELCPVLRPVSSRLSLGECRWWSCDRSFQHGR